MRFAVLLALIAFPLLELAVLIRVGQAIGVGWTLAIVIGTAFSGLFIIRWHGFTVLQRTARAIEEGRPPAQNMIDSAAVFVAGVLLITPGLIADTVGILLLVPWVRSALALWLARTIVAWGAAQAHFLRIRRRNHRHPAEQKPPEGKGPIIEVDYRRIDKNSGDKT